MVDIASLYEWGLCQSKQKILSGATTDQLCTKSDNTISINKIGEPFLCMENEKWKFQKSYFWVTILILLVEPVFKISQLIVYLPFE